MAALSGAWALIARTLGSNPDQGMDVCPLLSELIRPVRVDDGLITLPRSPK
jgi:hypothetical protein